MLFSILQVIAFNWTNRVVAKSMPIHVINTRYDTNLKDMRKSSLASENKPIHVASNKSGLLLLTVAEK